MLTVLGIDPGFRKVGLAVAHRDGRTILCSSALTLNLERYPDRERIDVVHDTVGRAIALVKLCGRTITLVSLEDQRQAQVSQAKAGRFTHKTSRVNEVVGAILSVCRTEETPVIELPPTTWKRSIGLPSRADKHQVQKMLRRIVRNVPARLSEHAGDALGNAVAGLQRVGRGGLRDASSSRTQSRTA